MVMIAPEKLTDSLQKAAKANSAQERKKEKSIRDTEGTQGETAGEEEETVWEKAAKTSLICCLSCTCPFAPDTSLNSLGASMTGLRYQSSQSKINVWTGPGCE
jgi:hypothetical protein